ncbi:hypothetical protein BC826DRAFT_1149775 [Russula brevipes]|nr:hypothetical protein BC826DRAFT_1149775 [Russula brevipes]
MVGQWVRNAETASVTVDQMCEALVSKNHRVGSGCHIIMMCGELRRRRVRRSRVGGRRQRHERIRVKAGEPESQNIRFQPRFQLRALLCKCHSAIFNTNEAQVDTGRMMAGLEKQGLEGGSPSKARMMSGRCSSAVTVIYCEGLREQQKNAEQSRAARAANTPTIMILSSCLGVRWSDHSAGPGHTGHRPICTGFCPHLDGPLAGYTVGIAADHPPQPLCKEPVAEVTVPLAELQLPKARRKRLQRTAFRVAG